MRALLWKPEFLILLVTAWFTVMLNGAPVAALVQEAVAAGIDVTGMTVWVGLAVAAITGLVLLLLAPPPLTRPILVALLLLVAPVTFFVANHGVLFDADMLANTLETNPAEAAELLTPGLLFHSLLMGVLPAVAVLLYPLQRRSAARAATERVVAVLLTVVVIATVYIGDGKNITSAVRNHRDVRYQLVPLNVVLAGISATRSALAAPLEFRHLAEDARHAATAPAAKPQVHVIVLGETVRADNFGLNGYDRNTTPELAQLPVTYFANVSSCGTATRISVPCMFSALDATEFDPDLARSQDNLLDIAQRAGYEVYWRENGNSCKHVCERVDTVDVAATLPAGQCPGDFCFDDVLITELRDLLNSLDHDALIVLHQIGSHGPAYFRRYPDEYRRFVPDCRDTDFSACSQAEIVNAYDNSILYTDHIIASAIAELGARSDRFDSSLIYVSDHGESLGENGLYLHGFPRSLAPAQQIHVPLVYWNSAVGQPAPVTVAMPLSHDNLFHSLLGLLHIRTAIYRPELDIFRVTDA